MVGRLTKRKCQRIKEWRRKYILPYHKFKASFSPRHYVWLKIVFPWSAIHTLRVLLILHHLQEKLVRGLFLMKSMLQACKISIPQSVTQYLSFIHAMWTVFLFKRTSISHFTAQHGVLWTWITDKVFFRESKLCNKGV